MIELTPQNLVLGILLVCVVCVVVAAKSDRLYGAALGVLGLIGWAIYRLFFRDYMGL